MEIKRIKLSTNNIIRVVVGIVFTIGFLYLFFRCTPKTTEAVVASSQIPAEEIKAEDLKPWLQRYDENIKVGDPMDFYNEFKIIVYKRIPITTWIEKDGVLVEKNESVVLNFPVPAGRKGKFSHVEPGEDGKPKSFTVDFKLGDKNYSHVFELEDSVFTLVGEKIYHFKDKDYKIHIGIESERGDSICRLMIEKKKEGKDSIVGGPAIGTPGVKGKKIIKNR